MKASLPLSQKVFKPHKIDLYQLLGSASETGLDDLASLAAELCATPIAFVSSIDSHRHWLKSQIGVDRALVDRYLNFCARAHGQTNEELAGDLDSNSEADLSATRGGLNAAIDLASSPSQAAPLLAIVRDASADERFATHPLVAAYPFVKFYAGMPIVTSDGEMLGVLSVMDSAARDLTKETINAMETVSKQVSSLVELRWQLIKSQKDSAEVEELTDDNLQEMSEAVRSNDGDCALQKPEGGTKIFSLSLMAETTLPQQWETTSGAIDRAMGEAHTKELAEIVAVSREIAERKQTEASQQERSRLSTLQAKVGAALAQGGSIPAILKRCTEAMVDHLDTTGASIWTWNPQTELLELQAASGVSQPDWEIKIQHWMLAESGKLQAAPLSPLPPPFPSPVAYPLIVEERLVGVMALSSSRVATEGALEVLGWMANAMAVAIDRVKAREELLSRREGLLFGLASQMRNSLDLDKILDTAVNEIRSLLQVDQCYFLWYSMSPPDQHSFAMTHEAVNPDLKQRLLDYPIAQVTLLAEKIRQRQTLIVGDAAAAPCIEPLTRDFLTEVGIVSKLLLPLKTRAGQMGAVVCNHYSGGREWAASEVELLQAVVDQLAIAIDQAELYAQTRAAALAAQTQTRQLTQTLQNLQQKEAQLIQNEKMSSLGQMVAGVAHEINNPVNFIYGNLTYCEQYMKDLLDLLRLYQKHYPEPCEEILDKCEEIDVDFVVPDLLKILSSMEMGAERIRNIVLSLRNFSRHDEAEMKPVDIHEGIDSTLLILQSRLKPNGLIPGIELIKEYGELPKVECYPGQLNQVFMNVIGNAIDALEGQPAPKTIVISTEVRAPDSEHTVAEKSIGRFVLIRIRDNGPGLSDKAKCRLFDPFFTTKPVGKGTGLGLSISYQIVVEKHQGIFKCISEPGQGAEFWIQIPLIPPAAPKA